MSDINRIREVMGLSEDNNKLYYHGRKNGGKYYGNYIYITDDINYASLYSNHGFVHVIKLLFPESKIFSLKNPSHLNMLKNVLDPFTTKSILSASGSDEMDWAAYGNVMNDEFEFGEDLLSSLGFKAVYLKERSSTDNFNEVISIEIFNQNDIKELYLLNPSTGEKKPINA